jgi:NAD+ synthase (glutamine-hydrolysing)
MKIALAQMNVVAGKLETNFNKMKELILEAKSKNVDLIVFPEMCVSGYFLQDRYLDHYFCQTIDNYNEKIKDLSDGIGIIYGNILYDSIAGLENGRDGRKIRCNTAFFYQNKSLVSKKNGVLNGRHIKYLNPDYRIFDDSRFFLSGLEICSQLDWEKDTLISPFEFKCNGEVINIGLEVCEDMWSNDYSFDVTKNYIEKGIDLVVNISCSPWTKNKELSRDKRIAKHALNDDFVPFIYVNNVGMQNNGKNIVTFDGDSTVYNKNGVKQIELNDDFKEELYITDLSEEKIKKPSKTKLMNSLVTAIKEFDIQMFNSNINYVIGLSGGLDSTVNAALFAIALGPERIRGYNLASKYNSDTTKDNARNLAKKLNIQIREGSIEKINEATQEVLEEYGYIKDKSSLTLENIQARIRGHLLSSFASIEGAVIINNGNKVELALGYLTLYGDSIGAYCPIADLTKVDLFLLSKDINEYFNDEIIPYNLLPEVVGNEVIWEMPPSAELKDNQLDPMKWFYHDFIISKLTEYPTARIEDFMESYLDGSVYQTEIGKWIEYYGLKNNPQAFLNDLEWILNTFNRNVFKRYQTPPVVMVSRGAFGNDFRESQINCDRSDFYKELKIKILNMKKADQ